MVFLQVKKDKGKTLLTFCLSFGNSLIFQNGNFFGGRSEHVTQEIPAFAGMTKKGDNAGDPGLYRDDKKQDAGRANFGTKFIKIDFVNLKGAPPLKKLDFLNRFFTI
jgi:hypothetical protein